MRDLYLGTRLKKDIAVVDVACPEPMGLAEFVVFWRFREGHLSIFMLFIYPHHETQFDRLT